MMRSLRYCPPCDRPSAVRFGYPALARLGEEGLLPSSGIRVLCRRRTPAIAGACLLAAGSCHASPYAVAEAALYGVFYLFGLVILIVVLWLARRKAAWAWILAGYVVIPTAALSIIFRVIDQERQANNTGVAEQERQSRARTDDAFAAWCKENTRVVHKKALHSTGATLVVKVEGKFRGRWLEFWAQPLAHHAARNAAMCNKTSLTHLAGPVTWEAVRENGERELRFYALCQQGRLDKSYASKPRFELLLGESAEQRLATSHVWMYKSSVRLVDTDDGATLAEDSMYFLLDSSGEAGCTHGLDQLTSLIEEVFPKE